MSKLQICRICLTTDCKVYHYDRFNLKLYYEEVTAFKVDDDDGLPQSFCFECAAMLRKFRRFKERCHIGLNLLKEINWIKGLSYQAVSQANRLIVQSPIQMMTETKRVKTYCIRDKLLLKITESDLESSPEDNADEPYISEDSIMDPGDHFDPGFDPVDPVDIKPDVSDIEIDISKETSNTAQQNISEDYMMDLDLNKFETYLIDEKPAISNDLDEEKEMIQKLMKNGDENNETDMIKPKSPETVFVAVKNEVAVKKKNVKVEKKKNVKVEKKRVRKKRSYAKKKVRSEQIIDSEIDYSEFGLTERNPAFACNKRRFLNKDNWKIITMTKEEAIAEFRRRSDDPKYVTAHYKCTDCFKWFRDDDKLNRHIMKSHDESSGAKPCFFCGTRFKHNGRLRVHLRSHLIRYECQLCDRVCNLEETANMHESYHKGVKHKCKHCYREFTHITSYYTHLRCVHRSEYLCPLCGVSFVSKTGLQHHKVKMHSGEIVELPEEGEDVNTYCEKCNIRFETKDAYEEHVYHSALHTDDNNAEVTKAETSAPRKDPEITHGFKERNPNSLTGRRRASRWKIMYRLNRKQTACHQCNIVFETQAAYLKHHQETHPRTSSYPPGERQICEFCGKSLAPGSVAAHMNKHTREVIYKCETCGREFHANATLKRHIMTHTGEKPYPCPLCDKRFTQSNAMQLHYRTFHLKEPYPKRFKLALAVPCPLCDKKFTQKGSMKLHYRTFHLNEPYPKRNRRKKEPNVDSDDSDTMPLRKGGSNFTHTVTSMFAT